MDKYELTSNFKVVFGKKLYQIKALIAFENIEANELGGYIEKEENLNQEGNAWVSGNAQVSGNARVYGNAQVYGNAWVYKPTHLLQIGTIGSRNGFTTFFRTKDKEIYVSCGCFLGTTDEFTTAVKNRHAGTKHEKAYLIAIELAKLQIDIED